MTNSPFTPRADLTGIAIAYKNSDYIADEIYPYVPVMERAFEWDQFALDTYYNLVNDAVGPTSRPNEVRWSSTRLTSRVIDHALDSPVPSADMETEMGRMLKPDQVATAMVMELILLNREKRAADLTFTLNNYPSNQRTTLSGSSQFSDPTSNPISVISDALDLPIMRPNRMIFGAEAWTKFARHPAIVEAVIGTGATKGIAREEQVAQLFGVEKVMVGRSRANAAVLGQTPVLNRLWGKHLALIYHNPLSRQTINVPPTWGMTARLGTRTAGNIPDPDMGMDGGYRVRAGEKVAEFIVANNCGYLFRDAVA